MAKKKKSRDIEKNYPPKRFAAKLRRLADAIESGGRFRIQIAGERISIPADAVINLEHEREGDSEEVEGLARASSTSWASPRWRGGR